MADLLYANIGLTNISEATMSNFYANSGLIRNATISSGVITGELIGVTIRGDRIIANTLVADKLKILGEDGLYYALNTNGIAAYDSAEGQTLSNSLNGKVITAGSIVAENIS